jgi:hypothetical protein
MALAYSKDENVAWIRAGNPPMLRNEVIEAAKRYEKYILTGE